MHGGNREGARALEGLACIVVVGKSEVLKHLLREPVLLLHHGRRWAHERLVWLLRIVSQVEIRGLIAGQ